MSKHTPAPWVVFRQKTKDQKIWLGFGPPNENHWVGKLSENTTRTIDEEIANCERIVECVNACEGINPLAIPELCAALFYIVDTDFSGALGDNSTPTEVMRHTVKIIEKIRERAKQALIKTERE